MTHTVSNPLSLVPLWWWVLGVFVAIIFFSIRGAIGSRNRDVRRVMPVRFWVFRFFTGQHLDGKTRTNSTFRYRGDTKVSSIVKATKWQYRAGWERLTVRMVGLFIFITIPISLIANYRRTLQVMTFSIVIILIYLGYRLTRKVINTYNNWRWIAPLHLALHKAIGRRRDEAPETYIRLPMKFRNDTEAEGYIDVPPDFTKGGDSGKDISNIVNQKLGTVDVKLDYYLKGKKPYIRLYHSPAPPENVDFSDVAEMIQVARETRPVLGLSSRREPVHIQLDHESPHLLVSARTGAGKSTIMRTILSQMLRNGAGVVICDLKRVSHLWAKNLPGVIYCSTPEAIHKALIATEQEVETRYQAIEAANDPDLDVGRRIVVVVEELNTTSKALDDYWLKIRERGQQRKSPAIQALGNLAFMGRGARVHIIVMGQMVTARSLGGGEARENFATRILSQHTINAWKMLIPEHSPAPARKHPGRVYIAIGTEVTEVQVAEMTEDEARTLALESQHEMSLPRVDQTPTLELDFRLSLRQACEQGWIPIKYATARQRKSRDSNFPAGSENERGETVYTRQELEDWYFKRQPS